MATPLSAAGAYAAIARLSANSGLQEVAGIADPKSATNFSSVLKEALGSVEALGQKSEAQTRGMVNGKSNMVDVVTAVSETEVAIDAVVAVRDKIIQAYEDIMKMPI
jgi:flagellar hook-basal body complex protein FliE